MRAFLVFASALGLGSAALASGDQPTTATQPGAGFLARIQLAELPDGALDRSAWSGAKTRDGIGYRTAESGNAVVSVGNFWGQTASPPPGVYALAIAHFDTAGLARMIKMYSGGGEDGFRYIGVIRGTGTNRLVTDTLLVNAEDMVSAPPFHWDLRILFARDRPADVVSIGVRRATEEEITAARQAALEAERAPLVPRTEVDLASDIFEPGETISYYRARLQDLETYRGYRAGADRDIYRRFELHYFKEERDEPPVQRPATEEELQEYQRLLETATSGPATAPADLPFVVVALVVKKPAQRDVLAPPPPTGVVAFTRSIYGPISRMYTKPTEADRQAPVAIRLARDEWEGAPVLVWSDRQRAGLRVRVTPLQQDGRTLAGRVSINFVTFAPVGMGSVLMAQPLYWWPQPSEGVRVEADRVALFWVDVFADPAAKPGQYQGSIQVLDAHEEVVASLPMQAEVLPIQLPSPSECPFRMGFFCGMLPAPRMQQILLEHNCNTFAVWVNGTAPLVSVSGQKKLALHFEPMDEQLRHARRLGMGPLVWFLATRPEEFPQTLDLEKSLLRAALVAEGKVTVQPDARFLGFLNRYFEPQRDAVGPPVRDLLEQWARLVADHAGQAPWPELALCPMDQPEFLGHPAEQWAKNRYADIAALVRQASGKRVKVFGLIRQPAGRALIEDCDLTCVACLPVDPGIAAYARQHNEAMWTYGAARYDCPVGNARFLAGVEPMHIWSDGLLIWALEWGQYTSWQYVGGEIIPDGGLLGVREGGDDRRYAEALLRLAKDTAAARAVIDRRLEPTRTSPTEPLAVLRRDNYQKYLEYAGLLDQFRRGLADEILRLAAEQ